jgi:hypothetical protein
MWDLWWTKWNWDRLCPEHFRLPLPVSFHRCPTLHGKTKKQIIIIIIIIITGLHNKPQGCGASVAYAAGPFSKKSQRRCGNVGLVEGARAADVSVSSIGL